MAQQFDDKAIIPLAINGYDLRASYHQVYESFINQRISGIKASDEIDLMDSDGFCKLIASIDKYLQ